MSASPPYSDYFRCRTIGRRAASPPTWACYEQIPYDDDDDYSESGSESCSEDDEEYRSAAAADNEHSDSQDDSEQRDDNVGRSADDSNDLNMDIDEEGVGEKKSLESKQDVKGKQRAIEADSEQEPEPPKRHHRRKQRHNTFTLRPILTIQRSQGFVWNQVSFAR